MLQYIILFILFSFVYRNFFAKETTVYYNSSIKPYLIVLENYKNVYQHGYKKTVFHINRFYYYHFMNDFEKCKKHYECIINYLNQITFRLENNIQREQELVKLIQNIETVLIQHLTLNASRNDEYYNNTRTHPEYY
jgi:hypothetical protein